MKFIDHYTSSSSLYALWDVLDIFMSVMEEKNGMKMMKKKRQLKGITRTQQGQKKSRANEQIMVKNVFMSEVLMILMVSESES